MLDMPELYDSAFTSLIYFNHFPSISTNTCDKFWRLYIYAAVVMRVSEPAMKGIHATSYLK
jgi:hypothetical protein